MILSPSCSLVFPFSLRIRCLLLPFTSLSPSRIIVVCLLPFCLYLLCSFLLFLFPVLFNLFLARADHGLSQLILLTPPHSRACPPPASSCPPPSTPVESFYFLVDLSPRPLSSMIMSTRDRRRTITDVRDRSDSPSCTARAEGFTRRFSVAAAHSRSLTAIARQSKRRSFARTRRLSFGYTLH